MERYLKQGTKILLTGRIQNDNYTNQHGEKVYSFRILADEIEFAESKNAGQGTTQGSQEQLPPPVPNNGFMDVPDGVNDADLPFN